MAEDLDPAETRKWLDSLDSVLEFDGPDRATSCWMREDGFSYT
jgi:pyruvate dehydrogenase complex dehydrogenase (E1) component